MGIRVLLVDDEIELTAHLAERLALRGLEVATAADGEEALRYVAKQPVDVIVLDLQMPGMDGLQTLREVKRIRPRVEVVLLTGHGTMETAIEGKRIGASGCLIKPCDIVRLTEAIRSACGRKAGPGADASP